MLTAGSLAGAQELIASWLAKDRNKHGHYFTSRVPKMAAYGALVSAPLGHFLIWLLQKTFRGRTSLKAKIMQIVVSNLIVCGSLRLLILYSLSFLPCPSLSVFFFSEFYNTSEARLTSFPLPATYRLRLFRTVCTWSPWLLLPALAPIIRSAQRSRSVSGELCASPGSRHQFALPLLSSSCLIISGCHSSTLFHSSLAPTSIPSPRRSVLRLFARSTSVTVAPAAAWVAPTIILPWAPTHHTKSKVMNGLRDISAFGADLGRVYISMCVERRRLSRYRQKM